MSFKPDIPVGEPAPASSGSQHFLRYLLPFLVVPALMLASAFFIVPSRWLTLHAGNLYLANIGYGAQVRNRDCQVLIYGDSAAMVGVDPTLVQRRTGVSVCNIAEFEGMTVVNRTMTLDIFLRHNPAPRLILFLYAPEDLNEGSWTRHPTFEAISFRLRQGPSLETAAVLGTHPDETFKWAEDGLRMALAHVGSKPYAPESTRLREARNGQLQVPESTMTACEANPARVNPQLSWIAALRSRYSTPRTMVLVDAVPTPDCDPANEWYARRMRGAIDDEPLPHFPIKAYTSVGLHTNEVGSRLLSEMVAEQVGQVLSRGPGMQSASLRRPALSSASH